MTARPLEIRAGFIPLLDCAPLIVAHALGFAAEEGLALRLARETSWATLRDRIAVRHLDVAHMLGAMPLATNLGLSPLPATLVAPIALGCGGNAITVSQRTWQELQAHGAVPDLDAGGAATATAALVARRRRNGAPRLTFAVVHPHSAHRLQLAYWLAAAGVDPEHDVEMVVVPPSLMPAALGAGQIDGFCVGEPWGSVAVRASHGQIVTTSAHIWRRSPDKVLGMRRDWVEADPDRLARLLRAVYRAALWCDAPENHGELVRLLSAPDILDQAPEAIAPGLERRLDPTAPPIDGFLTFVDGGAAFPWRSHALWFLAQLARWGLAPLDDASIAVARDSYRPDLYRSALGPLGAVLPTADLKVEGALATATACAATGGTLMLGPDTIFDGRVFDPTQIETYVASFDIRAH